MTLQFNSPLFTPDTILPVQFYPTHPGREHFSGSMRLLWAVLEEAYMCVAGTMTARSGLRMAPYREAVIAHDWFLAHDPAGGPFTFANICAVFGLAESRLRAYADRQFQRLEPVIKRVRPPGFSIRVTPTVRLNATRRAQLLPAWLPLVEIRQPGHRLRRLSLHEYHLTEDMARRASLAYIASEGWNQDAGRHEGEPHDETRVHYQAL